MFPIINIGPIAIQAAGAFLLVSAWFGIWLTKKFAASLGTNGEVIENTFLVSLLTGVAGARLGFLLQNPSVLSNNPLSIFALTPTMLNISFGILVSTITILVMSQKYHLPLWPSLDTITPFVLFLFIGINLANLANGDQYGLAASLPWGITLWGAERHPLQIYTLILAFLLFIGLLFHTRGWKLTGFSRSGLLFSTVIAALSIITLFTRAFAAEKMMIFGLDGKQLLSFLVLVGSLILMYRIAYQKRKYNQVYISMGSNFNAKNNITAAIELIQSKFKFIQASSIYQSRDVLANKDGQEYLNLVFEIRTDLSYPELRNQLKSIEQQLGRVPGEKKHVPLDLDILTYNDDVFVDKSEHIPSPDLVKYRYIAEPLAEITPDFRHPANGNTIADILARISDTQELIKEQEVENGITK
jgi:2-amino-4-hydroxy-6-hydroxymethyldihydropteridine diphosphokinase